MLLSIPASVKLQGIVSEVPLSKIKFLPLGSCIVVHANNSAYTCETIRHLKIFFLEDRNINKAFALSVLRLLHFEPATAFNLPLLLILYETALVRKTSL